MKRYTKKIKNDYCEYLPKDPYFLDLIGADRKDLECTYDAELSLLVDKLGQLEDLEQELGCPIEAIVFMFNVINRTGFLPLLIKSSQSIYTEEGEYFMTEKEYEVFKKHYPKKKIYKNYGAIDKKLSIFDK